MSLFDLSQRADIILKKYEKYDAPMEQQKTKSTDPFSEEYDEIDQEVDKLLEAAEDVKLEHSRSVVAQKNAEIRRVKQVLLTEAVQSLEKKLKKGKGVNKQVIDERKQRIYTLIDKIEAVPDGMSQKAKRPVRYGKGKDEWGGKRKPIMLDVEGNGTSSRAKDGYYQHTEQTQQFDKEWAMTKARQDEQLDRIGNGVTRLGEMARNMHEELDRQNPIIDDIEQQMEKVTGQLKTNNAKLKGLVQQMRSSRNFCVDVILISIILAIGAYIYTMFKK